ncbi:MAG: quinolinate synthase NadA [Candidatus Omnitrophica bacterium]|nr:quinolinate synthase NadA [Candidatus Omnitrophota bacterium]MBU1997709.1 quinolinate synthase NadA [Candidatus Omnitrophota bacterium]MBU4333968.1 quinolinate synthase NadA [Candidatus Omnitrophota bacterium]
MNFQKRIEELKKERNAVILVHNYQLPEVQDIGDFTGDSLGLSIEASKTTADVIVFCGVYFMAETAKILSPHKTVLIPDATSGCPMADMITADQLRELKAKHPKAKVMCYVNTSAEVKAECDYCCTSANAEIMLNEAFNDDDEIIFVPDKYLASYSANKTGRKVIFWNGYCKSHLKILPEHIQKQKELHPNAITMAHPECLSSVTQMVDEVLSTSGMLKYVNKSKANEFIVGTEVGMLHPLQKANPQKKFYAASDIAVCPNMKKITLEKVIRSLEDMRDEVILSEEIISKAQKSIFRMINIGNNIVENKAEVKI